MLATFPNYCLAVRRFWVRFWAAACCSVYLFCFGSLQVLPLTSCLMMDWQAVQGIPFLSLSGDIHQPSTLLDGLSSYTKWWNVCIIVKSESCQTQIEEKSVSEQCFVLKKHAEQIVGSPMQKVELVYRSSWIYKKKLLKWACETDTLTTLDFAVSHVSGRSVIFPAFFNIASCRQFLILCVVSMALSG